MMRRSRRSCGGPTTGRRGAGSRIELLLVAVAVRGDRPGEAHHELAEVGVGLPEIPVPAASASRERRRHDPVDHRVVAAPQRESVEAVGLRLDHRAREPIALTTR
jgi:hypothetical protein